MLETFLSGQSFTDVLSEVSYTIDVGEQDKQLAQQIQEDQQTLAAVHQTVAGHAGRARTTCASRPPPRRSSSTSSSRS